MKTALALTITALILAASLAASITPTVNYQGRLTDASGSPVGDGEYEIVFSIYTNESSSSPSWTSGPQKVPVSGGLFTYELGSNVDFPNKLFSYTSRWLGIKIGTDAEILPRTLLQSVPYAHTAAKADTALNIINDGDYVHTAGDTINDDLVFDGDGDGDAEGIFSVGTTSSSITLNSYDSVTTKLYGSEWGELNLFHRYNGKKRVDLVAAESGGRLYLYDTDGELQIRLSASYSGTASAVFPDSAIDSDEIFNEMGFASGDLGSYVDITSTSEMADIVTATISPPASGYFHISASYTVRLYNTTGANGAYFQIGSAEGGGVEGSGFTLIYQDESPTTGSYYFSGHSDKVYHLISSGTFTFRLEAMKLTSATGDITITSAKIIARYYPTSYGPIQTIMTDPGDFSNAKEVTIENEDGNTHTVYEVDLRELELKAKEAKIKALEAQIELDNAKEAQENNNRE